MGKDSKKRKEYTRVVSKLKKDPKEMTVTDLLNLQFDLEVAIMDIAKGATILKHLAKGCIEVHWFIPIEYINKAIQIASVSEHSSVYSDIMS